MRTDKKIGILYVTWGEVIVRSGIFRNQVVEQLILTGRSSEDYTLHLLSGIPLVNMKLLKSPVSFRKEIRRFKEKLADRGIRFTTRMIPAVSAWFYARKRQFPLYRAGNTGYLKRYVRRYGIDIVHCRSYQATYFALRTRERYGLAYKVIFDTRGLFPEEGVIKKAFIEGDPDFAFCKGVEQYCLSSADAIVNVSDTFSTYIRSITTNPNIHTIFTSVNLELFHADDKIRRETRRSLGIKDGQKVLTYLGDVRNTGWHQSANLALLYKAFAGVFPDSRLLVITEQDHEGLKENMSRYGVAEQDLIIGSSPNQAGINALLNAADFGCLPFRKVNNEIDRLLGYTMIASKTGEYLAAGLPVITNRLVGAASSLIERERLGVVYAEEGDTVRFDHMDWVDPGFAQGVQARAAAAAADLFGAARNAERYGKLYHDLVCSPS